MTKILLVDDSPVDLRLFTELLNQEADFEVFGCSDGEAALDAMATEMPDVVVTDMQMPVMDGVELVAQTRVHFPLVPVILITGHGSENLATDALRAGAAGYVPKSHSTDLLVATIKHVLELSATSQLDPRVSALTKQIQYELTLDNDETLIPGMLQLARQRVNECTECPPGTLLQLEVALEQALLNAIYHGNLEFNQHAGIDFDPASRQKEGKILNSKPPYCDRHVSVAMRVTPDEVRFVVKDDGNGFDVREVSSLGLTHSLRGEFGQGLFLMWAFMDKVVFDKTGSSVTLVKRLGAPEPELELEESPAAEVEPQDVILVLKGKDNASDYEVRKDRVTIGRDPSCDVVIKSAAVSHHHCILFLHEGWWFARDLKSKNGIKVNGMKHDSHLIPPSCTLSVGPHEFDVEYQPHKLGGVGITPPENPF